MIEIGSQNQRFPAAPSARPTVYVVDDDAAVLGSLRFLLETDGFDVRTFRNATALLNAAGQPDCYVIDYKMPDINGIDLAGRLRQSDEGTPVILITGYPDGNISVRAAAAGVKDVILKPLLDDNLAKCIRHAIQARH
ncbi:response regulator [Bradyrhizobium sp. BR 10289]|uniref:response regulator n=1 Tax=Bradyrhizobium sp. BR 10289 TaxID=2749993 RepID=UPI001C648A80|nr:response regulator [Bradyrhizobium sp. BR 10289]MBW7972579.1 response regulator [Bradyrhizobium sp. BR 10289]